MKHNRFIFVATILALGVVALLEAGGPTPNSGALPVVTAGAVPFYPYFAHLTNTQAVIHVRVSTDGHQVVSAHAQEDIKPLSGAAEENAKTWKFTNHTAVDFTIAYQYKLSEHCGVNNPTVTLWLPNEIEICQYPYHEY